MKSLRRACRKLAAHYLVRQRNLETVCRSVRLVAHFWRTTDCVPQRARLCARTGIVCEKCATIYSYSKQALIVCQKCARGFSLYFYSVKVSRVCDKVCQNSMMIFLFIYVYLKCVWIGIVFSWKEKVHEKEPFFHTTREACVCSGQYFISIIHECILYGNIQMILLNHACTNFLYFTSEWCLARNSSDHNVKWAIPFHEWPPPP